MRKSAFFVVAFGVLIGCGPTPLPPTPLAASLRTEDAEIEILGLREWTLEMVQDSLAKYAPEAFLRRISGEDTGSDPGAWMAWIASVQ